MSYGEWIADKRLRRAVLYQGTASAVPPRSPNEAPSGAAQRYSALRQVLTFTPYKTKQNIFAGINPNWPVCIPMMQINTLFTAAKAQPSQHRRPTSTVDATVKTQEI